MSDRERNLNLDIDYETKNVTSDVDEAVRRIFTEASRLISAKLALLSRPELVKVKAQIFIDGAYKDVLDGNENHDDHS